MSKNLKLAKRIASVCTTVCVVAGLTVSAFAYNITVPSDGYFVYDGTQESVTVPVTGTSSSGQVTIVVRKDNDNWLTDPNNNVVYIDQVTGAEGSTSITFGIDSKWLDKGGLYKVYVGGSSQVVTSADLKIGNDPVVRVAKPTGVVDGTTYYAAPTASIEQNDSIALAVSKNGAAFANVATTNGNYTFTEDGSYIIKAVDTTSEKADSETVSFTVAAAAVKAYTDKVTALTGKTSWTAAEVASIDGIIAEYNGYAADKKTAVADILGADFVDVLNNIKTEAIEVALADVYAAIDALPAAADVTEGDAAVKAAVDAIDASVAALSAEWGNVSSYVNAYADGKLPAVKSAVAGNSNTVEIVTVFDEAFEIDGKVAIEASLGAGNGEKKIVVGGEELYYSIQNKVYVGLVDSDKVSGTTVNDVVVTDEAPTTFVYGNVDGDDEFEDIEEAVDSADLLALKRFVNGSNISKIQMISAELDGDGLVDSSDLLALKRFIASPYKFSILK